MSPGAAPAILGLIPFFPALFLVLSCSGRPVFLNGAGGTGIASLPPVLGICSWNLGYASLGSHADFVADGGRRWFPSSRPQVLTQAAAIGRTAASLGADAYLFQEVARPCSADRRVDLLSILETALPSYSASYSTKVRYPGPLLSADIGQALFSRVAPVEAFRIELPGGRAGLFGFRQSYHLLAGLFRVSGRTNPLLVLNVHLSAFDRNAELRRQQLAVLRDYLVSEYGKGRYVVCGGDWNLRLVPTSFPHTTRQKFLFWVFDRPGWFPPTGWTLAAATNAPSVRTLERPYVKGENYTTVIDGFVLSPNIRLTGISNLDTGFRASDHQPAHLRLRLE